MKRRRWTGRPELWANSDETKLIIRDSEFHAEVLSLTGPCLYWQFIAFKHAWTFDFFNGSKYLQDKGWKLIERL